MTLMDVYGILAPPRVSRNDNMYLPEELAKADGLTVPMYLDHEDFEVRGGQPTGTILRKEARGRLKLIWNKVLQRLEYAGQVWDATLQGLIKSGQRPHVSLAAEPRAFDTYRGHNVPLDMQFFSVAAVENPGIPESTLNYTMEQLLGKAAESLYVMESHRTSSGLILMEFDTLSLTESAPQSQVERNIAEDSLIAARILRSVTGEHDFDAAVKKLDPDKDGQAIAALKSADEIADRAKEQSPEGPQMQSVSEPLHPDFAKMKAAMSKQYGDKGDSIYYATVNKKGLDDTKPMPKEAMEEMGAMLNNPSLIPQGYQNLTPMRANTNQRSGLTGVTGVSQGVPMQGDGTNVAKGVPDTQPKLTIEPTAQDQQIAPRNVPARPGQMSGASPTNLQPRTVVNNPMATGTGVSRESANKSNSRKSAHMSVSEDDGRGNVSQALQKDWGAPTDKDTGDSEAKPHDVGVKNIGMKGTPYEQLLAQKVLTGNATKEELALYNHLVKEGRININGRANPETQATAGVDNRGNGSMNANVSEEGDGEDDGEDGMKKAQDDLKEASMYGFTNEEFYGLKSTHTKEEWPAFWATMKEGMKSNGRVRELIRRNRLEASGVIVAAVPAEGGQGRRTRRGLERSLGLRDRDGPPHPGAARIVPERQQGAGRSHAGAVPVPSGPGHLHGPRPTA